MEILKNNDAYVDDDDGMTSRWDSDLPSSIIKTIRDAQCGAQLWADLLDGSGQSIAFHKSMWQLLGFDPSFFPPRILDQATQSITLRDREGAPSTIKQYCSDQPNPALGCHLAPTGQQLAEFNTKLKQLRQLMSRLSPTNVTITQAYSLLHPRIIPKISFPMALTSFTNEQCRQLNTALDPTMLNKLHINQHAPKAALYSSFSRGGLNYPSFRIIQAQKGICTLFLEDTSTDLSFMAKHQYGWFFHLREQLKEMNGVVWIEHQWTPSLQREYDVSIMEALSHYPISKPDRMRINFCRLYARVITISDITNMRGTAIQAGCLTSSFRSNSTRHWPNLPKPPEPWWALYRSAIRKAFAPSSRIIRVTNELRLVTSLGDWLDTPRNIKYEYHRNADYAFVVTDTSIDQYTCISPHHFTKVGTVDSIPQDAHPITAHHDDEELFTSYAYSIRCTQPISHKSLIQHISYVNAPDMAGSDGSVDVLHGKRACAYCVQLNGVRLWWKATISKF